MRLGHPLVTHAAVGYGHTQAGPEEVEAVDAVTGCGGFGEDLFPRHNGELRVVVEVDFTFRPFKSVCRVPWRAMPIRRSKSSVRPENAPATEFLPKSGYTL